MKKDVRVRKKKYESITCQKRITKLFDSKNGILFLNYLTPKLISYDENLCT